MTLSNEIQIFLDSQIEYYTKEAKSYKEMAVEYNRLLTMEMLYKFR